MQTLFDDFHQAINKYIYIYNNSKTNDSRKKNILDDGKHNGSLSRPQKHLF